MYGSNRTCRSHRHVKYPGKHSQIPAIHQRYHHTITICLITFTFESIGCLGVSSLLPTFLITVQRERLQRFPRHILSC